jgi:alkylated DNA repair protein alkB homolog 1
MSGPLCRRAYHGQLSHSTLSSRNLKTKKTGVPRILEGTLPEHFSQPPDSEDDHDSDWEHYERYMRGARININVRQVFPKGFDPPDPRDWATTAR